MSPGRVRLAKRRPRRGGKPRAISSLALVALLASVTPLDAADEGAREAAKLAARGSVLFVEYACPSCHTKTAEPGPTGLTVPLENLSQRYTARLLAELLDVPPPDMPRFPLTGEDRRAIATYLLAREARPTKTPEAAAKDASR